MANVALSTNPGARSAPQDDPKNLFKRAIYSEVRQLIIDGRQSEIERIVHNLNGGPQSIGFNENPFYWALYALKQSDELDVQPSTNAINSLGWQLLHAHRHRIDPELLVGFLNQTAASRIDKQKLIKNPGTIYYESWFNQYILRVRANLPERLRSVPAQRNQ